MKLKTKDLKNIPNTTLEYNYSYGFLTKFIKSKLLFLIQNQISNKLHDQIFPNVNITWIQLYERIQKNQD